VSDIQYTDLGATEMKMRTTIQLVCVVLCAVHAVPSVCSGESKVVWEIGKTDKNFRDLAIAGNYEKFAKTFRKAPVFAIAKDDAAKSWPFIHPGPDDEWAGRKKHTFTITFDMKGKKPEFCTLKLNLVSAQGMNPPELNVNVNGTSWKIQTERGTGDEALTDPKAGRPRTYSTTMRSSVLKAAGNRIAITTTRGSWILYDSVQFVGSDEAPSATGVKASVLPCWYRHKDGPSRAIKLDFVGGPLIEPADVAVLCAGKRYVRRIDTDGKLLTAAEVLLPIEGLAKPATATIAVKTGKKTLTTEATVPPQRKWEIHLVHQTHLDIGYTHTQEDVLKLQVQHLRAAMKLIEKTRDYPPDARFRWHPEGMWAVDEFLRTAGEDEKTKFIDAARKGEIHQDVLYAQAMTGVYSEEELFELMTRAKLFERRYKVPIVSAMQTDVPGYTWGLSAALAHHGVKYITAGPNNGHRVGRTYAWGDRPFYWVSPSGKHRVLFWLSAKGYAWFFGRHRGLHPSRIMAYLNVLERSGFPYDIVMLRYAIAGDNGPPDGALPDQIKAWNAKYAYPRIILSTNSDVMKRLEKRYADKIPVVSGDFTPYWEDGVASTSGDTSVNRRACEKIVQAQAMWAMLDSGTFPSARFDAAWTKMIMYDEHTWGAYCSISRPESEFTIRQVKYKQKFALDGEKMTEKLLSEAVAAHHKAGSRTIDVYNTTSWTRKRELVTVDAPKSFAAVKDDSGKPVPSQRMASGKLAFLAGNVPPFGARRYTIGEGKPAGGGLWTQVTAQGTSLTNELISLKIDPKTGAVASLKHKAIGAELVDSSGKQGINDYLYILGRNAARGHNRITGPVRITIEDPGPLVATLLVESAAPGCKKLTRRIRLAAGCDYVAFINVVDKLKQRKPEGVYFAFPLKIPKGISHIDIPWAVIRPETDQMKGANRNYYCVQRWVDISNADYGATWVTVDAPMLQFHPIKLTPAWGTAAWRDKIEPGQTFYSWVMNNHWETNYKAYQEGKITFRYILRPHAGGYDQVNAQKFARSIHQPLLPVEADPLRPVIKSMLTVTGDGVVVTSVKPSRDGKALMVRLFNTSPKKQTAALKWARQPKATWISNPMEDQISKTAKSSGPIEMVKHEIVTLRVER